VTNGGKGRGGLLSCTLLMSVLMLRMEKGLEKLRLGSSGGKKLRRGYRGCEPEGFFRT